VPAVAAARQQPADAHDAADMNIAAMRDVVLHRLMQVAPVETCSALGAELGVWLGQRSDRASDVRAKALLQRLHPEAPAAVIEQQARELWRNIGCTFAEFSVLPRIIAEQRVTIAPDATIERIAPDPRPVIVCFVHLGNWEVLGAALSSHPTVMAHRRMSAVIAPPANPARAAIAARLRGMLSVEQLTIGPGVWRTVLNRLRQPFGTVWLAADAAEGGVDTPLFHRPPRADRTLGKIVRLAASTGALIVPAYCERLPGVRFVAHVMEPYEVRAGVVDTADLLQGVADLNALFDTPVRRLATQWYMAIEFPADAALAATTEGL
jgi:KDO2-lipid IV(A) lauroyltransferase